jgi:hypothetical protein
MKLIIVTCIILLFIAVAAGIFFYNKIDVCNAPKYSAIFTLFGVVIATGALIFVGYQTMMLQKNIENQTRSFSLENRPYLHAEYTPSFGFGADPKEREIMFGGVELSFINEGKIPASIIPNECEYISISNEMRDTDQVAWFKEAKGAYPDVTTVFPGQKSRKIPIHPMIGKNPKLVFVWCKVVYTGINSNDKYWYKFTQIYNINYISSADSSGNKTYGVELIKQEEDWDRNVQSPIPLFKKPDWNYYLSRFK